MFRIKDALIITGALIGLIIGYLFIGIAKKRTDVTYGVTFSRPYAETDFGLNADDVLTAALDDLHIRRFRIPAYWSLIEPQQGTRNFDNLDRDINAIGTRGGGVVLAIGEKLPRWPECWGPAWWKQLPREEQRKATLTYLETVVTRYAKHPNIIAWQVENEPHFAYGDCPKPDNAFLDEEIALVRRLDPTRPILSTDSGELSLWASVGKKVDQLGVSVYRVVQNPTIGIWRYWFLPPYFYRHKASLIAPFGLKALYVSEFQMEPWSNVSLSQTPIADQLKTFDAKQMEKNFDYASKMGLSPIDFWGVEWWYWMKEKMNHPEFWAMAKQFWSAK